MKKIFCFFVIFLISNAADAADKWEYCSFKLRVESGYETVRMNLPNRVGIQWMQQYSAIRTTAIPLLGKPAPLTPAARGQKQMQSRLTKENILYTITDHRPADANELSNALGKIGWEMVSTNHIIVKAASGRDSNTYFFYFKRKL